MTANVATVHHEVIVNDFVARFPHADTGSLLRGEGLIGIWKDGIVGPDELADFAADHYEVPRGTLPTIKQCKPALGELSHRYLRDSHVYPFDRDGTICLALADPGRRDTIRAVRLALGSDAPLVVLSFEEIDLLFEGVAEAAPQAFDPVVETGAGAVDVESIDNLQDLARGAPIVRLIDGVFERAVQAGATDIHFETERDHLRVRLRVDGFLRQDQRLPLHLAPAVLSRIKILANLDIADRRLPQDGRCNVRVGSMEADLRVAVMPTMHGETAVLRILSRDTRLLDFARIGMADHDRHSVHSLLDEPNGIVIVTGPTGSGKTTTLAAALSILNDPSRKIVTIEDPVEYQIPGVHQTQLKSSIGLTFASALRSFLRHDPDVIMVGEMRDHETASVGVQAALTGHLVLTTLHTNSAADAVIRLMDMGVESYLLGASLRGVIGQRLVRRLCDRCKAPDEKMTQDARQLAQSRNIPVQGDAVHFGPTGCDACGQSGYRGRIGIFEVMRADEPLRSLIRDEADTPALVAAARAGGMSMMLEDGLRKCAAGQTSLGEVLRATG
ncbi:GspE/PulE family protein [Mesorhizobium sp. CAU 1741]|uniref:GspE/PulE family protein n=1 Tax=Mesorhizobium sp. CAU 1741 TaxID=3140366 RepID=UPI00325A464D